MIAYLVSLLLLAHQLPEGHRTTVETIYAEVLDDMIDTFETCGWRHISCSKRYKGYRYGEEHGKSYGKEWIHECVFDIDTRLAKRRRDQGYLCP